MNNSIYCIASPQAPNKNLDEIDIGIGAVTKSNKISEPRQNKAKIHRRLDCVQLHCLLFAEIRDTIRITIRKEIGKNYICHNIRPFHRNRAITKPRAQHKMNQIRLD